MASLPRPCVAYNSILDEKSLPLACTMSSSRGKKTAVPASKKRNGAFSSAGLTTEIRHPLLQFPRGPQEELF
ncbi:hypothetical protein GOBAR_AA11182 [Gossypium barbadense]|uniref:Uncharacterized protein n=1 Tax=Gossypium barbadense TaxID=3634 RepID=A0A2P5Y1N2_GOSBA|nr:hypothetical protein GOBAR_AA11182 [Gossypium barbadense]